MPVIVEKQTAGSSVVADARAHGIGISTPKREQKSVSVFICALVIFAIVNLLLWRYCYAEKHPVRGSGVDANGENMWASTASVDIAADQFKNLSNRADVVLLGSSLIMNTFWMMDRRDDPNLPDVFHYRGSRNLEHALSVAGEQQEHVFNMASFGQMVSDSYIWANEFLKAPKTPDVVVLGVAPRDFYDADLSAVMATFTFKRLVGLRNLPSYAELFLPRWTDKLDFVLNHACYFYGKRWRLQHESDRFLLSSCRLLHLTPTAPKDKRPPREQLLHQGFLMEAMTEDRWANSKREYHRRYHDIDTADLSIQYNFLARLLQLCHQRGIKVVLVDMPLSAENRAEMPAGFYRKFQDRLRAIAKAPSVSYVDLSESKQFNHEDFWDTAHLNANGGHKLVEQIMPALQADLPAKTIPTQ
ncbi:MAG TPA: hypothetical protein V6C81_18095 [Planktothrix sp.]|jgi:hypothetical protein